MVEGIMVEGIMVEGIMVEGIMVERQCGWKAKWLEGKVVER